ncbi:AraC family transcriptional regulator [bacterium]|nr:MAG: AraC family transcriptional regulator [bacterium]
MSDSSLFEDWFVALFKEGARFEVSLAGVASRMRAQRGWVAKLHSQSEHLLYFVAEGAFDAQMGGETRRIITGDLLWGARGTLLDYSKQQDEELVVWRFRLKAMDENDNFLPFERPYLHLQGARECEKWINHIVDEASEPGTHSEARMRGLLACLLSEIIRHQQDENERGKLSRAQRAIVRRVLIETNFSVGARELAEAVSLTPDYFSRCFRHTFGVAPRNFVLQERLKMAALRLLESPQTVSEIAHDLGYRDIFLFSRQFKAHFGQSPTQYRTAHSAIELPNTRRITN